MVKIILNDADLVEVLTGPDGETPFILTKDDLGPAGMPNITYGVPTDDEIPVNVEALPSWATHAQIFTLNGQSVLLPLGGGVIADTALEFVPGTRIMAAYSRGVVVDGDVITGRGPDKPLHMIWQGEVDPPTVIERITLTGEVDVETTAVVGSRIHVASWPIPSRTGVEDPELWIYDSATATSPSSMSNFTQDMVVPNTDTKFFEVVYQIADATFNETIRRHSDRFDISTSAVGTDPIVASDITWYTSWIVGENSWGGSQTHRQLVHAEFDIVGVGATAQLQWRVNCQRYQTGWADCPIVEGTRRTFGGILCPSTEPHAGVLLNEFLPQLQDMWAVEFRWRPVSGTGSWFQRDPGFFRDAAWLRVPMPTGLSQQFNATPAAGSTANIATALTTGWAATGLYLIGLAAGTYEFPTTSGSLESSNKNKTGGPLVITSINRASPALIRGSGDRLFDFQVCNNFILDRVNLHNNVTQNLGWTTTINGVTRVWASSRACNDGIGVMTQGCQRFYIQNCSFKDLDVGHEARDCGWMYRGFNVFEDMFQDGYRLYWRGNNYLIEGEDNLAPETYPALIDASDDPPVGYRYTPIYHPDMSQASCSSNRASIPNRPAPMELGGLRNFRWVHSRGVGVEGGASRFPVFFGGNDALRSDISANKPPTATTPNAKWTNNLHRDWYFRGLRMENHWGAGLSFELNAGVVIEDCIFREPTTGSSRDLYGAHFLIWIEGSRITNSVSPFGAYFAPSSTSQSRQTGTQKNDEVDGNFTLSTTDRPVGWTRNDFGFPCGPDAYRAAA